MDLDQGIGIMNMSSESEIVLSSDLYIVYTCIVAFIIPFCFNRSSN